MLIEGQQCMIKKSYRVRREFRAVALKTTSGNVSYRDYGITRDKFTGSFTIVIPANDEVKYKAIMDLLMSSDRRSFQCEEGEYIFGSDIDNSSYISCGIVRVAPKKASFERYEIQVRWEAMGLTSDTSIDRLTLDDITIALKYNNAYSTNNSINTTLNGTSAIRIDNAQGIFKISMLNTLKKTAGIKRYLTESQRLNNSLIPGGWNALNAFYPHNPLLMIMDDSIEETFNSFGLSTVKMGFYGIR